MKEAIVNPDLSVEIKESPIPTPGPGQILIKVIVSGMNPKASSSESIEEQDH